MHFLEKTPAEGKTLNVSRNGILVDTSLEREVNSFVRLRIKVPPTQAPIEVYGKVARLQASEKKTALGIQFLELDSEARNLWLEYVAEVESLSCPTAPGSAPGSSGGDRRQSERSSASFLVRFRAKENLAEFATKNLSTGGMFLATPVLKPIGEQIRVVMIHPTTDQEFELGAEVVRTNSEPTDQEPKGMALKFQELGDPEQERLQEFLEA